MYGIFTYITGCFSRANDGKYSIHGAYGIYIILYVINRLYQHQYRPIIYCICVYNIYIWIYGGCLKWRYP